MHYQWNLTDQQHGTRALGSIYSERMRKICKGCVLSRIYLSMLCEPDVLRRRLRHQFISHLSTVRFLGIRQDRWLVRVWAASLSYCRSPCRRRAAPLLLFSSCSATCSHSRIVPYDALSNTGRRISGRVISNKKKTEARILDYPEQSVSFELDRCSINLLLGIKKRMNDEGQPGSFNLSHSSLDLRYIPFRSSLIQLLPFRIGSAYSWNVRYARCNVAKEKNVSVENVTKLCNIFARERNKVALEEASSGVIHVLKSTTRIAAKRRITELSTIG